MDDETPEMERLTQEMRTAMSAWVADPSNAMLKRQYRELQRRYPPDPDAPRGVPHVLRTGQSEIYAEIPDAMLVASARDAEHLEILRIMSMKSAMLRPVV